MEVHLVEYESSLVAPFPGGNKSRFLVHKTAVQGGEGGGGGGRGEVVIYNSILKFHAFYGIFFYNFLSR